jgi:glycosyltransferase-like protein
MKIAFFTYSTKPRGSVVHTIELANALVHLGHEVGVYALDKEGQGFDTQGKFQYFAVPAQAAPSDLDQLISQRIQEFVKYFTQASTQPAYDIYHAQDCIGANALATLRAQQIIPHFVRTVHHIEAFNSPYLQACQTYSVIEPDQCFCVSQHWQGQLLEQYGIQALRINNGVNCDHPLSAHAKIAAQKLAQTQFGITGCPVYLTVGGIEPRKNSHRLLEAFAQVRQQFPTAQLVIAGGATLFDYQAYRDEFFNIAKQLHLVPGQSLLLPGVVTAQELVALYHSADAFVFPSHKEGWGLVVLEAIACGLPVITSNQPPFTEFLHPEQALLVDPNSLDDIAQAMLTAIHPEIAHYLTHNSYPICQHYTWENSAKMHLEHYNTFIHQTTNP